jgi:hypothetical protein
MVQVQDHGIFLDLLHRDWPRLSGLISRHEPSANIERLGWEGVLRHLRLSSGVVPSVGVLGLQDHLLFLTDVHPDQLLLEPGHQLLPSLGEGERFLTLVAIEHRSGVVLERVLELHGRAVFDRGRRGGCRRCALGVRHDRRREEKK